ncbi:hypothetical protein N0V84_006195 [Fusarium piperis]|uniref:Uncharacterized protein n=1 Tax=Fusarium piperis TaxID=1435070 RepID=A0A9W8WCC4_9HYPO|nr:hypothetical protein N0V84_006195 [Fusarium piperis]
MLRGCKPSDAACEHHTAFVELGPWASETLPTGAAETGVYDVHGTVDGTMYSSVCDMSRSVIVKTKGETGADFTLSYHPVTLTGGLRKLASASTAISSTKASSTGETSSTDEASSVADVSSDSATDKSSTPIETETISSEASGTQKTSSSAVPAETASAGSPPLVRAFAALAVAGMAAALVV